MVCNKMTLINVKSTFLVHYQVKKFGPWYVLDDGYETLKEAQMACQHAMHELMYHAAHVVEQKVIS